MALGTFGDECLTLNSGQVGVTAGAAVMVPANGARRSVVITNNDAANPMYLGQTAGVTAGTGHYLPAGQSVSLNFYIGAIYAIVPTTGVTASYLEEAK